MKFLINIFSIFLFFVTATFSQSLEPIDLEKELVVHFPFDGNLYNIGEKLSESSTLEAVYSKNQFNVDSTAIYLKTDPLKIDFYVGVYSNEYSVSLWFKPNIDLNADVSKIPLKIIDGLPETEQCFAISYDMGKVKLNVAFPNAEGENGKMAKNAWEFPANFNKDVWYFLNISFGENNDVRLTINHESHIIGRIESYKKNLGIFADMNKPMLVGGGPSRRNSNLFNASIDDLRIYTRILQENELDFLFKKKTEIFPLPIINWQSPALLYTELDSKKYKIKACIKTDSQIQKIQILINDKVKKNIENPFKIMDKLHNCDYAFEQEIDLENGANYVKMIVFDKNDGIKHSNERLLLYKQQSKADGSGINVPILNLFSPTGLPGFKIYTKYDEISISGTALDKLGIKEVKINDITASYDAASQIFKGTLPLSKGDNIIKVVASNINDFETSFIFYVNSDPIEQVNANSITELPEKRLALIIGNANYENSSVLRNPINDARIMKEELDKLGFKTVKVENGTRIQILEAISTFSTELAADTNSIGLFYFAGHGMQSEGNSFILPVDAKIEKKMDITSYCIDLETLMGRLVDARNNMNLIILDACRNNPFSRSFRSTSGNGLGTIGSQAKGTFVAFATSPGMTAADGNGNNGLYTQELVSALRVPKLKIEEVFKRVRNRVIRLSNEDQIPWENSSLTGDFYFKKK